MFGLFKSKVWKVGEHRVKKVRRSKTTWNRSNSHTGKVTRYKCVKCERVLKKRESFIDGDHECYEIVQE